jgi:hypothetical protein
LTEGLAAQGVQITAESYCTIGKDDATILGSLDLRMDGFDSDAFTMGLGFRASNNKQCSVQLVAAARVQVCSNWMFAGSDGAVFLKRKHTARLDIRAVVPSAVEQFLERAEVFRLDIDRMQSFALTDGCATQIVFDIFNQGIMPVRLFPVVSDLYFRDEAQRLKFPERTLWSINNACTEAIKLLKPVPQQACGLAVGRLFGQLIHRREPEPEPIAVIDGIEVFIS